MTSVVRRRLRRTLLVRVLALLSFSGGARAHGQDANIADVRLSGDTAYVVATPSVAVYAAFDDDKNGRLHVDEVARHREALLARFDETFRLVNEVAASGERIFRDVSTPHAFDGTEPEGASHLRFTFRYRWREPPVALRVQWREAKHQALLVRATRVRAAPTIPEQVPLGPTQAVELVAARPGHVFFGSMTSAASRTRDAVEPQRDSPSKLWFVVLGAMAVGIGWVIHRLARTD